MADNPPRSNLLKRWPSPGVTRLLFCLVLFTLPLRLQAENLPPDSAKLASLDTQGFPRITGLLDVRDAQGRFVHDLQANQVRILEDERPLPVVKLEEQTPGVTFVVAMNPGRSFAIRDGQGFSRYDRLLQALQSWASAQANSPEAGSANSQKSGDDYSLLITDGPQSTHLPDSTEWLAVLEGYQADLRSADARLDVLVQAVAVAANEPPRPGMGRLVLFITPPPEGDFSSGLEAIVARAVQQGIRICVWLVASPELFTSPGASQLQELASQTGGTFFPYSGVEPVPNLEDLLAPMRSIYSLEYDSRIASSGPHQVSAEVFLEGFDFSQAAVSQAAANGEAASVQGVVSPPQAIDINIQPPNPVFVDPPGEIVRESQGEGTDGQPLLTPRQKNLDVLVEFPDGFQRTVVTLTLYVDGQAAAVRSQPPFTQIPWDLSSYLEDGVHNIRLEVVDSQGMSSASREIPVQVFVRYTPRSLLAVLTRQASLLAALAVVFSGAVLALVLILAGRIQPSHAGQATGRWRKGWWLGKGARRARRVNAQDPVTQSVRGASVKENQPAGAAAPSPEAKTVPAPRQLPSWMDRLQRHSRRMQPEAHALLARMADSSGNTVPTPIPITTQEVVFGQDPEQVSLVLNDPSIEPIHARLRLSGGVYRILDEGTTAGTWVNYTPVSKEGTALEHGDLLHIGRIGFRFLIREPARVRKPVVKREDHLS